MSSFTWLSTPGARVDCEVRVDRDDSVDCVQCVKRPDCVCEASANHSPINRHTHTGRPVKRSLVFETVELVSQSTIISGPEGSHSHLKYAGCIASSVLSPRMANDAAQIVMRVPLQFLCQRVPLRQLIEVCAFHSINVPRRSRTLRALTASCMRHLCSSLCFPVHYVFSPLLVPVRHFVPYPDWKLTDAHSRSGNAPDCGVLDFASLQGLEVVDGTPTMPLHGPCQFVGHVRCADVDTEMHISNTFVLTVPLHRLTTFLTYRETLRLAASHRVFIPRDMRTHECLITLINRHNCTAGCGTRFAVFRGSPTQGFPNAKRETTRGSSSSISSLFSLPNADHNRNAIPSSDDADHTTHPFPPLRLSNDDIAAIVSDWCDATDAHSITETACAVCGELVAASTVTRVASASLDLSILTRVGVSVVADYPALYEDAVFHNSETSEAEIDICCQCLRAVKGNRLPKRALANGLWIGNIPDVLRDLTFVEKMVISKYRHNACVVEVRQGNGLPGQRKMRANAIIFPQPVGKVYNELPPPRDDLDSVLAILFIGPCVPTQPDYQRTPLLIRHNVVVAALTWLIAHNVEYRDVYLSQANLLTYAETEPPVCVLHRTTDGLKSADSMAVFDSDGEEGTATGMCEFIVHGLSADQLVDMSYDAKVATALKHFNSGQSMLAFGHDDNPASMYHNSTLYPGMFPWLYPYGLGGFENSNITTRISRTEHIRHLLLYADRRFQIDEYFPLIAFNQEQIRGSTRGGYLLTKRSNFEAAADKILDIDCEALQALIDRASKGEYLKPDSPTEKQCFELLSLVDLVSTHVPASSAQRKNQRTELKSMIMTYGVPVFFITFAPADFKNPLCMYYAGERINLMSPTPVMPNSQERLRVVASNPVACARFFHTIVTLFTECILQSGKERCGLFGHTRAYYGRVEAQNRLSLHLHLLLWISSSLRPQEIRDRLLDSSDFRSKLLAWLEQCHTGDFSTGTVETVRQQGKDYRRSHSGENDPVMQMPVRPPPAYRHESDPDVVNNWLASVLRESDQIVMTSNMHSMDHSRGCKRTASSICRARFPREVVQSTHVDPDSGAIRFKKREPWLNTYNPILSYLLRCNSDVTCLLSGTQVRAVVAYVTDYITKGAYKTHDAFGAIKQVVERMDDIIVNSAGRHDAARAVIVKIVNALSAMQQVGGPAACAYLLGYPDHYTDQKFKVFCWTSYVAYAAKTSGLASPLDVEPEEETVGLTTCKSEIVPYYRVNDYIYRPAVMNEMTLYEFLSCSLVKKTRPSADHQSGDERDTSETDLTDNGVEGHKFAEQHPLFRTHLVYCLAETEKRILNFVGPALPRVDTGEREEYCKVMLVFFKPGGWRNGKDLIGECVSWSQAFNSIQFAPQHVSIMRNMNVLYECLDARDDYSALRRQQERSNGVTGHVVDSQTGTELENVLASQVDIEFNTGDIDDRVARMIDDPSGVVGVTVVTAKSKMATMSHMLSRMYGQLKRSDQIAVHDPLVFPLRSCEDWSSRISVAKERFSPRKQPPNQSHESHGPLHSTLALHPCPDFVGVVDRDFVLSVLHRYNLHPMVEPIDHSLALVHSIATKFALNEKQLLAFGLVARHLHHHETEPMRMYLGGMGGTGKSTVVRAIIAFLSERQETHRFLVLAPTGTAACNVDGQTYHSAFGFHRSTTESMNTNALARLRRSLDGVDIVFFDEVSMLSCAEVYRISGQMCKIFGKASVAFGGKSIIFCGDFAQLPPPGVGQFPLYSDALEEKGHSASLNRSKSAQGKALWEQFTTVVILRQNMRQRGLSEGDVKFRTALENMRYRSCTPNDLETLSSRIVGNCATAPSLRDLAFRDVSLITSFNVDRDAMNAEGALRFAEEHGQTLHYFHSVDRWGSGSERTPSVAAEAHASRWQVHTSSGIIGDSTQKLLWDLPPHCTDNHAGVLPLCVGMPVLLKHNEATELCATNGAEATVLSWHSHKHNNYDILDTLFVLLRAPARTVQVEGLPDNVIPLTKRRVRMKLLVQRPSQYLRWDREQVCVLLNFAMTDFGAQGKTRPFNPCHLTNSRTHQSLYTCLSRSASLAGTLIMGSIDTAKITGGCAPSLRKEFQMLEILDAITAAKASGTLPDFVKGATRRALVGEWLTWKGVASVPPDVHEAIKWDMNSDLVRQCLRERELTPSALQMEKLGTTVKKKRMTPSTTVARVGESDNNNASSIADSYRPRGMTWDSLNWSCAFDAALGILCNCFCNTSASPVWTRSYGSIMTQLISQLRSNTSSTDWDAMRDGVRTKLHCLSPSMFPVGREMTSVSAVLYYLLQEEQPFAEFNATCNRCNHTYTIHHDTYCYIDTTLLSSDCTQDVELVTLLTDFLDGKRSQNGRCGQCNDRLEYFCDVHELPSFVVFERNLAGPPMTVPQTIAVNTNVSCEERWRLAGTIYLGSGHFTSRFVDCHHQSWYHDGITTGPTFLREFGWPDMSMAMGRPLTHAVYVLV